MISPLIALMDDQVLKLKERGFAVECIHSGRDRETSRRVCVRLHGGQTAVSLHCSGTASGAGLSRDAGQAKALADRHRRGALHLAMGPRFSPGLSHAWPVSAESSSCSGAGTYGHSDAAGAERHCDSARADRAHALHPWFPPRKYRDRDCGSPAFTTASARSGDLARSRNTARPSCTPQPASRRKPGRRLGRRVSLWPATMPGSMPSGGGECRKNSWRASWTSWWQP